MFIYSLNTIHFRRLKLYNIIVFKEINQLVHCRLFFLFFGDCRRQYLQVNEVRGILYGLFLFLFVKSEREHKKM